MGKHLRAAAAAVALAFAGGQGIAGAYGPVAPVEPPRGDVSVRQCNFRVDGVYTPGLIVTVGGRVYTILPGQRGLAPTVFFDPWRIRIYVRNTFQVARSRIVSVSTGCGVLPSDELRPVPPGQVQLPTLVPATAGSPLPRVEPDPPVGTPAQTDGPAAPWTISTGTPLPSVSPQDDSPDDDIEEERLQ